jgi:hypothetical protein
MKKHRIYCNSCKNNTWHTVAANHKIEREDHLWGHPQLFEAEILCCCGCDLISFRLTKYPFEFQDKHDKPEIEILPERAFKEREQRYFFHLPREVHNLYQETLAAHNRNLILLSTVGLRALLEAIVADKLDKKEYGPNLESKITALGKYFKEPTINTLQEFRVMGNKAIHSQLAPHRLDMHRALYVVEGVMEFFYGIDEHVDTYQRLKETTKKKSPNKKIQRTRNKRGTIST